MEKDRLLCHFNVTESFVLIVIRRILAKNICVIIILNVLTKNTPSKLLLYIHLKQLYTRILTRVPVS